MSSTVQRIQTRRDTIASWGLTNPTLAVGEVGVVTDAASDQARLKIGRGLPWNATPFFDPAVLHEAEFHGGETARGIVTLGADVVRNANTYADVTGLQFPVANGGLYKFEFVIPYTTPATNVGSRWSINGPAFSMLSYRSLYPSTAAGTALAITQASAYDLPATAAANSPAGTNLATIEGVIRASAAGDVVARFASENTNPITALAGASVEWSRLN